MNRPAIEISHLSKCFGTKPALHYLSLQITRGGVHAIVGRNGAGKSTLLRILLGLMTPSSGESRVFGIDSQRLSHHDRSRIGFVNDEHSLPSWLPVSVLSRMHREAYPQWIEEIFREVVNTFDVRATQKVSQLSRGERAGLSLALALAQSPELLILDEPTTGLDVVAKQTFLETLLLTQRQLHCTVLYCSHQMDEVERVADNLILIELGQCPWSGAPEDFSDRVSYWVAEFADEPPANHDIPGLLRASVIEGQLHYMVLDQKSEFSSYLQRRGARNVYEVPIGLDKAINGFLSGPRSMAAG